MSAIRPIDHIEIDELLTLRWVFRIWKYGFVFPNFWYEARGMCFTYRKSLFRIFACSALITCSFASTFLNTFFGRPDLTSLLNMIYFFMIALYVSQILIKSHQNHDKIEKMLRNILRILSTMQQLEIGFKKNINYMKLLWFVCQIVNFLTTIWISILLLKDGQWNLANMMLSHIVYFIDLQFQLFYITVKFIMMFQYQRLNDFLREIDDHEDIKHFTALQDDITKANRYFSRKFSFSVVWKFGFEWYSVTVSLYVIAMNPYGQNGIPYLLQNALTIFWIIKPCLTILILLFIDTSIAEGSKLTFENIQRIQNNVGRNNLPYKNIELYLLKWKINELKFSASGYFLLDWKLVSSIVASITTYLIYLIQFRLTEVCNKNNLIN